MKTLISIFAFLGLMGTAQAGGNATLTGCVLHDLHVKSVTLVLIKKGTGEALITCEGAGRGTVTKRVSIEIGAVGLGIGAFEMWGGNVSLGISNPYDLDGAYVMVEGQGAIGLGVGGNVGLRGDNGLSFNMGIKAGKGLGAGLTLGAWQMTVID